MTPYEQAQIEFARTSIAVLTLIGRGYWNLAQAEDYFNAVINQDKAYVTKARKEIATHFPTGVTEGQNETKQTETKERIV